MRPVNLLPAQYRPVRASGALQGSAYVVLGVLGALVVMVSLYVLTLNQISSRKDATAKAKSELAAANARASSLTSYGNFAQIKQTRTTSVLGLAQGRFDWERLMREVSLVMPAGTWITDLDASAAPPDPAAGGTSNTAAGAQPAGGPTATVTGCARRQPDVARLMVRLRKVHDVADVALKDSAKTGPGTSGGSSSPAPAGAGPGADCGRFYGFDLVVSFAPAAVTATPSAPQRVPASLGGGS